MANELVAQEIKLPEIEEKAKPAIDADRALISEMAMDIGKEVVAHIETSYPAMFEAVAGTAKLSIRNCIHNEIMAALKVNNVDAIRSWLERRRQFRRKIRKMARDNRGPFAAPLPSGLWQPMLNGLHVGEAQKTRKAALDIAEQAERNAEDPDQRGASGLAQ